MFAAYQPQLCNKQICVPLMTFNLTSYYSCSSMWQARPSLQLSRHSFICCIGMGSSTIPDSIQIPLITIHDFHSLHGKHSIMDQNAWLFLGFIIL